METVLQGKGKKVVIADGRPTVILGERINPTGKKKLAAALVAGDLEVVRQEALAQVAAGADILDVNVGAAGVDEVNLLPKAVRLVMETADVPVAIDTADGQALAAALAAHKELNPDGKPLVNSVNGEEASMKRVLPLVAEYGTAVIGLAMDDDGIPPTAEGRLAVATKIVERAGQLGIDTVIEGRVGGTVEGRLGAVADALALGVPLVVVMHHPLLSHSTDPAGEYPHRLPGPDRGRRFAGGLDHAGGDPPGQGKAGGQPGAGREQRVVRPAGARDHQRGVPGHGHRARPQLPHRGRGQGPSLHPGRGPGAGPRRLRHAVPEGVSPAPETGGAGPVG